MLCFDVSHDRAKAFLLVILFLVHVQLCAALAQ